MTEWAARILVVQPDREIRADLARELAARYGPDSVVTAATSAEALALLEQDRPAGPAVAVVELRLDEGSGTTLLEAVRARFPDVGRVLMGAAYVNRPEQHDESELMVRALDTGAAQALVTRPWTPATDRLFPVLDDQLEDWVIRQERSVQTITIVSEESSARGHELRDVLARNAMAHEWFDSASARGRALARQVGAASDRPLVLLHNGAVLVDPTNREVADALGVATRAPKEVWDLVIVGAGPAGLAAAVYGASEGLATLGVEAEAFGGQAGTSSRIENYLGFPSGISGGSLMQRAGLQAGRLGARALIPHRVVAIEHDGDLLRLTLEDRQQVRAPAVVLATGVQYRRLPATDVDRYVGAGVYYGSPTVELSRVVGGEVFVVGAGNSAGQAAVRLAENAASVTMVVRGASVEASMSHYLVEQIRQRGNIRVETETEVLACRGDAGLEEVVLTRSGVRRSRRADALFVMIGAVPNTDWLPRDIARDERGFVLTGPDLARHGLGAQTWSLERQPFPFETSLPHVFAVGDVRHGSIKRVASAVGEGSAVVSFVHETRREGHPVL